MLFVEVNFDYFLILLLFIFLIVIEQYTATARFCFICNYLSKIIPAVQSRCTRFRFGPLSNEQMMPRLQYVIEKEKLE
jgi:replication factor C subunit 3/5